MNETLEDFPTTLPNGWRSDRLKDLAEINGNSLPASTDTDFEFSYLEISNVDARGIIDQGQITKLRFEDAPSRARRQVKDQSILISSVRPNLQAIVRIEKANGIICSTGFNVVDLQTKKMTSRFVYYVLISENSRQYLESMSTGVGYPAVGDKYFGILHIPMPTILEQHNITNFLDASCVAIDAAIDAKQRQVGIINLLIESKIIHAVTKGLNDTALLKNTDSDWLPRIPENWEMKQIKRHCELSRGKFTHRPRNDPEYYNGEYPFLQTGNITSAGKYIINYTQSLNQLGFSVSKLFPSGTLAMSIAANVGDVAILGFEACFPDSMIGLIPDDKTDLVFLYYLMRGIRGILLSSAVLTTQLNLNYTSIGTTYAPFPPKQEQIAIRDYLDSEQDKADQEKALLKSQITTLAAYRKSLIHECVTGKRRVTEADLERVAAAIR